MLIRLGNNTHVKGYLTKEIGVGRSENFSVFVETSFMGIQEYDSS